MRNDGIPHESAPKYFRKMPKSVFDSFVYLRNETFRRFNGFKSLARKKKFVRFWAFGSVYTTQTHRISAYGRNGKKTTQKTIATSRPSRLLQKLLETYTFRHIIFTYILPFIKLSDCAFFQCFVEYNYIFYFLFFFFCVLSESVTLWSLIDRWSIIEHHEKYTKYTWL